MREVSRAPWRLRIECPWHGLLHAEDLSDDDVTDAYVGEVADQVIGEHDCEYRLEVDVRQPHVLR